LHRSERASRIWTAILGTSIDEGNDVRAGLEFYARCARDAWRRSWDAANAWPAALLLALYGGARLAGYTISLPGEGPGTSLAAAMVVVIAAWIAVFLVQMIAAPPRLAAQLQARIAQPRIDQSRTDQPQASLQRVVPPKVSLPKPQKRRAPVLDVRLQDQVQETGAVDVAGEILPAARAYMTRITNRGDKPLTRCQLFFGNATHIQVVSGPFDLAPGDHRDLPVLRVIDRSDEPHALAYYLDPDTWQVAEGQAAWVPDPGTFKIKVLSADPAQVALKVDLSGSSTAPEAWTLIERATVDETARPEATDRQRPMWAGAIAATEPNSGD
jgi:hypothetical protein